MLYERSDYNPSRKNRSQECYHIQDNYDKHDFAYNQISRFTHIVHLMLGPGFCIPQSHCSNRHDISSLNRCQLA